MESYETALADKHGNSVILEACVETPDHAVRAEQQGAHQLELCGRLDLDGLTPERAVVEDVLKKVSIPVKIMIRPRAGEFHFSDREMAQMTASIREYTKLGIDQFVIGCCEKIGALDHAGLLALTREAPDARFTVHKAIDSSPSPLSDIKKLRSIPNIRYLLTSGQAPTALEGSDMLRKMMDAGATQIQIIAAGKITRENLSLVHQKVGASYYHGKLIVGALQ